MIPVLVHCTVSGRCQEVIVHEGCTARELRGLIASKQLDNDWYLIHNGRLVEDSQPVVSGSVYHAQPRLLGGKGGFGSMLRALGAQIEKTTNREACRDLSGRRMRDINNEKKFKEWLAKKGDRDKEKEERRRARRERMKAEPKHKFDDQDYMNQKAMLSEKLEDSVMIGLQKKVAGPSTSTASATVTQSDMSRKRKADNQPSTSSSKARKDTEWLGVDLEDISDSDSDSGNDSTPKIPLELDSQDNSMDVPEDDESQSSTSSSEFARQTKIPLESSELSNSDSVDVNEESGSSSDTVKKSDTSSCNDNVDISMNKTESGNTNPREGISDNKELISTAETGSSCTEPEVQSTDKDNKPQTSDDKIEGKAGVTESKQTSKEEPFDLSDYSSINDLEDLGLDRLKSILMSMGLKCGGTLTQRAERLFSVRGLSKDQIDPSLFAKPAKGKKK